MKFSLINVSRISNGLVDGSWIQDHIGTLESAEEAAIATERANINRIKVAVVDEIAGAVPMPSCYFGLTPLNGDRLFKPHTPGPFRAVPSTAHKPGSGSLRMDIVSDGTEFAPSFVAGDIMPNDARLFVAAPDLLETLKYLIQDQPGTVKFDAWWESRVFAARAAISKAEGES